METRKNVSRTEMLELIVSRVYVASNGQERLDMLRDHELELVVADINGD